MSSDNSSFGWISLHRKLQLNMLFNDKPFCHLGAWVDLLMLAAYKEKKVMVNKQIIKLERGQLCMSQLTLSKRWGWTRARVRHFLSILEKDDMVICHSVYKNTPSNNQASNQGKPENDILAHHKSNQVTTLITICNYNKYQTQEVISQPGQRQVNNQADARSQPTINNLNKKIKDINAQSREFRSAEDRKEKNKTREEVLSKLSKDRSHAATMQILAQADGNQEESDKWQAEYTRLLTEELVLQNKICGKPDLKIVANNEKKGD